MQRVRGSATVGLCYVNPGPATPPVPTATGAAPTPAQEAPAASETTSENEVSLTDAQRAEQGMSTTIVFCSLQPGFEIVHHRDVVQPAAEQPIPRGWEGMRVKDVAVRF